MSPDEVSRAILVALQRDGRRSYAALGKDVGLSEAAVRQRVARMIEAGLMRIVAVPDPAALGFDRRGTIGVRTDGPLQPIAERMAALPSVTSVVFTAGSVDLLAEVACRSDEEFLTVIEQIRSLENVTATESFVHLRHAVGPQLRLDR